MKLPGGRVDEFARLIGRPDWGGLIQPKNYWKCRVVIQDDVMVAALMIAAEPEDWFLIGIGGSGEALSILLKELLEMASMEGIRSINGRLQKKDLTSDVREVFEERGFQQNEERLRYRRILDDTFVEGESRLVWKNLNDFDLEHAARMLERVGVGDPDFDPDENTLELLKSYLNDPVLTKGPDVVEIGYDGEEPVAFVCAQVNPRTKWGRITYIGVVPEYRGRQFGREVHRHGLAMLLRQGCEIYEGGTDIANLPMQSLFERNHCEKFGHEFGFTWRNVMKN